MLMDYRQRQQSPKQTKCSLFSPPAVFLITATFFHPEKDLDGLWSRGASTLERARPVGRIRVAFRTADTLRMQTESNVLSGPASQKSDERG